MKRYAKFIYSVLRFFTLFLRYPNAFKIKFPQRKWESSFHVTIKNGGSVSVKRNNNSRAGLSLMVNGGRISIGENNFFNRNVSVTSLDNIFIGDNCKFANNVVLVDHDHDYMNKNVGYKTAPIIVKNNVWIGANAVITKGVIIGNNSVVAAGAVVVHDVPDNTVVAGVPARVITTFKNIQE